MGRPFVHFGFLHSLHERFQRLLLSSNTAALFFDDFQTTGVVSDSVPVKKYRGKAQAQPPERKLGHDQENNIVYWLLTDFQI